LTTNRARTIDAALQSRIQLAIRYKDLTTEQKIRIYQNQLGYLPDDEFEDKAGLLKALEYSPLVAKSNKTNGRQIRNIVTYARALATSQNSKLTMIHLSRVDQVTSDFTESMKEVFNRQRARNEVDYND
jgi:SpoVK/Ycf46/Vps4 family AAA+-type ATPase